MKDLPIVVIGNGIAANSAVRAIRALDKQTRLVMLSDDPEPAHSACVLAEYLAGDMAREAVFFRSLKDYDRLGTELMLNNRVREIDCARKQVMLDDRRLAFKKLILATGSEPILPRVAGRELPGNFAIKTLADADAVLSYPASCYAVVGSGPIGVEVGAALHKRGCRVTVVEQMDTVLPKVLDKGPAAVVQRSLTQAGVEVRTSTTVTAVRGAQKVDGVELNGENLPCDAVIWAVGMRPRAELARQAGLAIGPTGGIRADASMRTSHPDIFACGDCAETFDAVSGQPALNLLWHCAAQQGAVAGVSCLGVSKEYPGDMFQMVVELPGLSAGAVGITAEASGAHAVALERSGRQEYHLLVIDADSRTILGAQSINNMGYLGPLQNAIRQRVRLDQWENVLKAAPGLQRVIPWAPQALRLAHLSRAIQRTPVSKN
jgi:NAD(P)H-nitrite reductase large subunit